MYRLIVVEDEEWIRKWLVYGIDYAEVGAVVVGSASNGAEGLDLIKEVQPDIVLSDIQMPVMAAFEMFTEADADFQKIIISGYSDFDNAKKAIHHGVVNFVTKPIDEEEVLESIKEAIRRIEREQEPEDSLLDGLMIKEDDVIEKILDYIHRHFNQKITMSQIAKELGYSESYLYRKAKENLKVSVSEYIQRYRISCAAQMLMDNEHIQISDLADQLGFSDYNYFSQVFKKHMSVSPTEYRKKEQNIVTKK